ncbi:Uncharacterised protein [Streptococcus constellatus]|uniref:DUF1642 domain-containing protein n=1 Tax=Streptococcus constellatus TaxID=76860 RepID=A0A564U1X7_STRCV|nr:DUF1642 domain-containing protein [Streptococcus constellatus]VUW99099.1 Uncharacterised protein [Streptococcus gordonii]VUX13469.1 Uncharacterised protein [Streptococcus constellatus]
MKYKLGDEVYLKGVITSINFCAEIKCLYEVKTADEFVTAAERHLEPINKEEAPLCLRNVLARLRGLPEHDREVWLKNIMDEFELDFSHAKWREGYEQGKFDGAVEAEKSNKVVIPQFVADIIEEYKDKGAPIIDIFTEKYSNEEYNTWLVNELNAYDRAARAWLDGYDVKQENRYVVTDGNHLYFKECQENVEIVILADEMSGTMNYVKKFDSKDEAQKVADVLGWKVQEVQNESKI